MANTVLEHDIVIQRRVNNSLNSYYPITRDENVMVDNDTATLDDKLSSITSSIETLSNVATTSANGLMSSSDKTKLDGIEEGANNYTHPTGSGYNHIPSGGSSGQILKWSSSGTAAWAAETDTTYSTATTTTTGLMSSADKTKLDGISTGATAVEASNTNGNIVINGTETTVYTHPTTSGNKHIPSGGSSGQILKWSADGTAVWGDDTDTTYSEATTTTSGLMSASDKSKLDGISDDATSVTASSTNGNIVIDGTETTVYTHPTTSGNKHIPTGGSSGQILKWSSSGTATWADESDTTYSEATTTTSGLMSASDKTKLDTVSSGATAVASSTTNGNITIDGTETTVYTHPTTSGNKHIPSGGSTGQILVWSADGTAAWGEDNDTTYTTFGAASSSAAGTEGLVPAPAAGYQSRYLRGDGTWATPTNTTYSAATTTTAGLMSASDKTKLDGIAEGATLVEASSTNGNIVIDGTETTVYTHPTSAGYKHIPSGGSSGQILKWSSSGTATWASETDTTYSAATTTTAGLMSASDKAKLDGIAEGATAVTVDTALSSTSTNPVQNKAVYSAISDLTDKYDNLVDGAPEAYDTLLEISNYISTHTDEYDALLAITSNKVDAVDGMGLSTNDYTDAEKTKLAGIETGAEVNQNAFSNVTYGSTTIAAASETDTLTVAAGSNVTITADATNKKLTFAATDTTYSVFTGATSSTAGTTGLVPAPSSGYTTRFLRGDGTWVVPTNTTYSAATTTTAGLMSAADKTKLDGISEGATTVAASTTNGYISIDGTETLVYSHPTTTVSAGTGSQTGSHGGTITAISAVTVDSTGHLTGYTTSTITLPTDNNTDTKVTNTLGTTTKAYVTGTSSSTTNTGTQYFDTGVYLTTNAGELAASNFLGDLEGNADTATALATSRTIRTNLASTSTASFNGTANITPGVTGILPIANGGTGTSTGHIAITAGTDTTSTASPAHSETFTTIDSVTLDTYGHVTAINTKTVTLPSDNNTDTKVTQTLSSTSASYPLLLAPSGQTATTTTTSYFGTGMYANPSTNTITATTFSGTASKATQLATARNITVNLASTSAASFNGTAAVTPGVSGILPIANGGTGTSTGHIAITTGTDTTSTASPAHSGTFTAIDSVTLDDYGHVTAINTKTVTLPSDNNTDTKVTNTLGTTTKAYVTGTSSATTNTGTQYFDTGVYLTTNAGELAASNFLGDLEGNASTATALETARTIRVNLASTSSVSFDGTANITPGVTGTLPIARGGTGTTTGHIAITAGTDTTSTASPAAGSTFTAIDSITKDDYGHVTAVNTKTVTLPSSSEIIVDSTQPTVTADTIWFEVL